MIKLKGITLTFEQYERLLEHLSTSLSAVADKQTIIKFASNQDLVEEDCYGHDCEVV